MFPISQSQSETRGRRVQMPLTLKVSSDKKLPHPATHGPRIFADTAAISEIEPLFRAGIISGVTTNPTLLKRAGAKSTSQAKEISIELLKLLHPYPVSLELTRLTESEMIAEAMELASWGENAVIKVPVGGYQAVDPTYDPYTGLKVIRALWERDIIINATLIFNSTQALWAARAGAGYVSPFLGRLADYAYKNDHPEKAPGNSLYMVEDHKNAKGDQNVFNTEYVACGGKRKDIGSRLIQEIAVIFSNYNIQTEILAASFRNFAQVSESLLAGADILTVPADILGKVADHPLTTAGMQSFYEDSKVFAE
ncbi:MAG: hypothetical protein K9M57_02255 [Phycisphaerae bacterium]|nr:hypothetical protein [Phycisphaerae bacterium]